MSDGQGPFVPFLGRMGRLLSVLATRDRPFVASFGYLGSHGKKPKKNPWLFLLLLHGALSSKLSEKADMMAPGSPALGTRRVPRGS